MVAAGLSIKKEACSEGWMMREFEDFAHCIIAGEPLVRHSLPDRGDLPANKTPQF